MKTAFLLILIAASIGSFFMVTKPKYDALLATRNTVTSYDSNLETAKRLKESRDELISRFNSIPKADLDSLKTLLPDSVDNIRLIIQLEALATRNGLSKLRNVDYQVPEKNPTGVEIESTEAPKPYGEFIISFQTNGPYKNFLAFVNDLERNLRLVDVTSVDFTPQTANEKNPNPAAAMTYKVTLKTYWLKQ
jgi:Tfp pilus assembly protein PilO